MPNFKVPETARVIPAGVSLPKGLLNQLSKKAAAAGISRSNYIRRVMEKHLKKSTKGKLLSLAQ